jgi:hypothetical protein
MSSPLIEGGVAAFFTIGYLGYLWTYSYTWPLGIIFSAYVLTVSFSLQRFTVFDVYIELPTAAEFGLFLAYFVANASVLPPLVPRLAYQSLWTIAPPPADDNDSDIEGGLLVQTYPYQASSIGGLIFIVGGAFTLAGVYGDNLTTTELLLYGIAGVVAGLIFTIYGFYGLFASTTRADRADGRYIIYLLLFAGLPPLVYNLTALIIRPLEIIPLYLVFITLAVIIGYAEYSTLGIRNGSGTPIALERDPRYLRSERYPIRIFQRWIIVNTLPILVIYTVCWVAESFFDGVTTGDSLGAAGAATLVMAVISLFFGGAASVARASGYIDKEEPAVVVEQRIVVETPRAPVRKRDARDVSPVRSASPAGSQRPRRSMGVDLAR